MTSNVRNNRQTAAATRRISTMALILTCVVMVTGGFFVAARQHFASMDYGMKNSRLRKQIDQLESEKRRLLLAREISLSPAEIKKAVKKIGIGESGPEPMVATTASLKTTAPQRNSAVPAGPEKVLVAKTASVKPTRSTVASAVRSERNDRLDKKGTDAE